jgi:glucosylceramidase
MPIGANDFSLDWYSYDETPGDFNLTHFSIANDMNTLVPFIKEAKHYNPGLKIWASPWSPPSWMKYNKHYAGTSSSSFSEMFEKMMQNRKDAPMQSKPAVQDRFNIKMDKQYQNNLPRDREGKEGTDMFIQQDKYLKAYALYFSKFIGAYKKEGIDIFAVMPQNEFNSAQVFPSCCWTAKGLANFIGRYLGPSMKKKGVKIFFGTMERAKEALVDTILTDPYSSKYVQGIGFQWAGKGAIAGIHKRYPGMKLYQSEQECGDGNNDWEYCKYAWTLMKHYISNGASAYMYWNIALEEEGISRWGWCQNSLVTVNKEKKTYQYNHEYYLLKHVSHFVQTGAKVLKCSGAFSNVLAFENPDKSIIMVLQNDTPSDKNISVNVDNKNITTLLKADSFNTIIFK